MRKCFLTHLALTIVVFSENLNLYLYIVQNVLLRAVLNAFTPYKREYQRLSLYIAKNALLRAVLSAFTP
jgi:hypothetical protein